MIPILSTFIFLIINLTMQHHPNHCSLSTAGEKMEHSILQTSSMGSSLTNDKDTALPVHGPVLPCWPVLMGCPAHSWCQSRQAAPSARACTHKADTAVRYRLQLIAPSLWQWPSLQNPCRTTTPDNSLKKDGRSNILHIYYTTSVIFGANFAHLLPLSYHLSQLRTNPMKCWDY